MASPEVASAKATAAEPAAEPAPAFEPQAEAAPIAAQANTEDTDSTFGDEESYTTSITSSITAYEFEHGRRYHAYQAGSYHIPNDEEEQQRLDLQYHALRLCFNNELFFAPIGEHPRAILDVGTGTGIWPIEVGDAYPKTEVIGTDLSPIQPPWVPPNVQFQIDSLDHEWTFRPDHFDLIHTRMMNGSIRDWPAFYANAFRHCRPGGWVESQEISVPAGSDDASFPDPSYIQLWCEKQIEAGLKAGMEFHLPASNLKRWMEEAGFVNVHVRPFKIPIGLWPADPKMREIGAVQLIAMLEGLQALTIGFFTRFLGWSVEEVEVFLAKLRLEFRNKNVHAHWTLNVVYGQKPENAEPGL